MKCVDETDIAVTAHDDLLDDLRGKLKQDSVVWFRSCSVFHGEKGHEFAKAYRDFFNCSVAAHTYLVSTFQSGLYILDPGEAVNWSVNEGGTKIPDDISSWDKPHTVLASRFFPPRSW